jgi:HlyD family secretion protein
VNVKKRNRTLWISLVILAVVILGGCGLARRRARIAAAPEAGDTVTVFVGDLSASASASGRLLPQREAQLALGISGIVEQVYVDVGDSVKAGDVLVQLETDDLERAVESARQSLAISEANLAELSKAQDAEDLVAAQAAVDNAQAQLDDLLAGPSEQEVAQAESALTTAQANLDDLLTGPSKEELEQAQAALTSAKAALVAAKARYEALDDQLVIAQNNIDNAQLAIDRASDAYDQLLWNSRDRLVAESWGPHSPQAAALKNAKISYDVAVANYRLTEIDVNDAAVRSAEAQVAQTEALLASLTEDKSVQIAAAEAQVARARANMLTLTEVKTVQIAAAEAQLAQAKAALSKLLDGPSEEQLLIAKAQVEQARISLEEAEDNLASAALVAPYEGTVTAVYVAAGELASGLAVELVDTESLEVVLLVDEIDIGAIQVGQPTVVTLETWPDRDLSGEVTSIAPKSTVVEGIVTYEVHLSLDAGDLPILAGMTANADLVTAQRQSVLLVPNRAIIADREASKYYVNKVQGEEIVKTEIVIGLRDNTYTEVISGLEAGDQVYIGVIDEGLDFTQGPPENVRERMRE